MMTTMAALMGTLCRSPIGFGAGSESRRPLGIAVVGGLIFSQVLTLYLTPVFYIYMEAWRKQLMHTRFARFLSVGRNRSTADNPQP